MVLCVRKVLIIFLLTWVLSVYFFEGAMPFLYAESGRVMFDFGEISSSELIPAQKPPPPIPKGYFFLPILFFIMWFITVFIIFLRTKEEEFYIRLDLSKLPICVKLLITYVLTVYGLVHICALFTVFFKTQIAYKSAEEYFHYISPDRLLGLTHAHLFGHITMYTITALIFLFVKLSHRIKIIIISILFFAPILDVYSWWLMKFLGGRYEALSLIAGGMFAITFVFMYVTIIFNVWRGCFICRR